MPAPADDLRRTTAPALLLEQARAQTDGVRLRAKQRGIYATSGGAVRRLVARTAKAFASPDFAAGDASPHRRHLEEWSDPDRPPNPRRHRLGIFPTASPRKSNTDARRRRALVRCRGPGIRRPHPADAERSTGAAPHRGGGRHGPLCASRTTSSCTLRRSARRQRCDLAWLETQVAEVKPEQPAFIVYTSAAPPGIPRARS